MLDKREFWKLCQPLVEARASQWGFRVERQGIFVRPLQEIWRGFAVVTSQHGPDSFYVEVGIHVPFLRQRAEWIDSTDCIGFEISHRLGTYRDGGKLIGLDEWYACGNERQLREECERMFRHFEAWALPWYEQFQTLADVADAFFHLRIAGPPGGWPKAAGPRPPDPFGWSMYGWMLEECGKREEATSWLQKAYDELSKPLWVKSGVPVAPGTKGAREMRRPVEEERLAELLRQSLGIPLEAAYPR